MEFSRAHLLAALSEVGDILHRRGRIGDVVIYGGSAMLLQFDVSFVTRDVDAIITAEHGEVTRAVEEVAKARGWPLSWLNEGVRVCLAPAASGKAQFFGDFPTPERVGLRVYVATPAYLLALKLRALRIGSRDVEDVVTLATHLKLHSLDALTAFVTANFPGEPLDARKRLVLEDVVQRLKA